MVPRSHIPTSADVLHQVRMALAALESGVHGLRLSPGNIRNPEHIKLVASECRERNVPIRMGRDVWLRSAEANINLGGEISITRAQGTGSRGNGEAQLALTGSLQTVRGTYQLNIGPVQRTFEVQQGSIDWFGDPDFVFNPNLDISAQHTVRQYLSLIHI